MSSGFSSGPRIALDPRYTDPARIKREREKARELRQSNWWKQKIASGLCHYCGQKFPPADLTMDHVVPLARGGESEKSNLVPACKKCNQDKKLSTPVDELFAKLEAEKSQATGSAWGHAETQFFYQLTPDRVIEAVERLGLRCSGRCQAMNSFENRVYDIELEDECEVGGKLLKRVVAKFYRPGRWTREQILDEHEFLGDLTQAEIPAVAPLAFASGAQGLAPGTMHGPTLGEADGIFYTLFERVGGRSVDELDAEKAERVGQLIARIHGVGRAREARARIELNAETYGTRHLEWMLDKGVIPEEYVGRYEQAVRRLCSQADRGFKAWRDVGGNPSRIHGDCHLGNLLWNDKGLFFVDFDDFLKGPPVQDLWLLLPSRDDPGREGLRDALLRGYERFGHLEDAQLALTEVLRGLRFIHFAAWIARRYEDPAFPGAFPQFGTTKYWNEAVLDLEDQVRLVEQGYLL